SSRSNIAIGAKMRKKRSPVTIGFVSLLSSIASFIHRRFNPCSADGASGAIRKKAADSASAHHRTPRCLHSGSKPIRRKKAVKTSPNERSDPPAASTCAENSSCVDPAIRLKPWLILAPASAKRCLYDDAQEFARDHDVTVAARGTGFSL